MLRRFSIKLHKCDNRGMDAPDCIEMGKFAPNMLEFGQKLSYFPSIQREKS